MKKVDILVILIVLLLSTSFYIIYFSSNRLGDDVIVEVTYKNTVIYSVKLEESTDLIIEITSEDNVLTVKNNSKIKNFPIGSDKEILNVVLITFDEIRMIDANCPNKYCLYMKLKSSTVTPIVCTNGIMIKLISDNEFTVEV